MMPSSHEWVSADICNFLVGSHMHSHISNLIKANFIMAAKQFEMPLAWLSFKLTLSMR